MLMTLGEAMEKAAAAYGDKPAVIFRDVPYSYDALNRRANRFANALVAQGIEPGDRVTLCGQNSFDWVAAYYGTAKAGAVLNPVTAMLTAGEIGLYRRQLRREAAAGRRGQGRRADGRPGRNRCRAGRPVRRRRAGGCDGLRGLHCRNIGGLRNAAPRPR